MPGGSLSEVTHVRELGLSALPECRSSSRRWRSVGMHSWCGLDGWCTSEQLVKGRTNVTLILACLIWYSTLCCRCLLSFSALGFIPAGLPLQLLLVMSLETCLTQWHVVFILCGWLGRSCNCEGNQRNCESSVECTLSYVGAQAQEGKNC